jgi:hypothetical protein
MPWYSKENRLLFLLFVGLLAWLVPGAGHFVLEEKKRAIIIFAAIILTFCIGLYIGSIGVIDLFGTSAIYVKVAQIMNPPVALVLGYYTGSGAYPVYGWPNEIGQVYTMTSGLLNLLCIVNAVYLAHLCRTEMAGG